jgi:hypothetical protein
MLGKSWPSMWTGILEGMGTPRVAGTAVVEQVEWPGLL